MNDTQRLAYNKGKLERLNKDIDSTESILRTLLEYKEHLILKISVLKVNNGVAPIDIKFGEPKAYKKGKDALRRIRDR